MKYILVIFCAYILGCSNMTLYLSKLKGIDARAGGSGNLGASNAMVLMGWKAGVLAAVHDIGKSALAVLLAQHFFPELPYIGAAAGVASVYGHIFPFYLKFKGGKGFASYLGMTLALNWKFALAVLLIVLLVTVITDYIVVGTMTTITIVPLTLGFLEHSVLLLGVLMIGSLVILWKHRENFQRLRDGTEIGLRSAGRGDHRQ